MFTSNFLQGNEYLFEGHLRYPYVDQKSDLFAPFLPKDPNIYIIGKDDNLYIHYKNIWPLASVLQEETPHFKTLPSHVDLLVIDSPNKELAICQSLPSLLEQATVIYITTYLAKDKSYEFKTLQQTLELKDFLLLGHWVTPNEKGDALFIRKESFDDWKKVAILDYNEKIVPTLSTLLENLEQYLQPINHKTPDAKMDQIDYIYMINLDSRPEKFTSSQNNLTPYGIKPFRFSAVNGWTLPLSTINDLGVKLTDNPKQVYTGTVFESLDFKGYRTYLPLDNKHTFYGWQMSHGGIGCLLSHLSILQDALQSNYQTIWVMEDDIEVVSNPHRLSTLIKKLNKLDPQWDILFTDIDTKQGVNFTYRFLPYRPNLPIDHISVYLNRFKKIDADFQRIGMRLGSYSMILRRSAMEKILNFYKKYALYLPYDQDLCLIPNLKLYSLNYDVVSTQADAVSDSGI